MTIHTTAYEGLMQAADARGARIGLHVGELLKTSDKQEATYRPWTELVATKGNIKRHEKIVNGNLETAAQRLLPRLP